MFCFPEKAELDVHCRSLERERTEMSVANEKLSERISEVERCSAQVLREIETLACQDKRSVHARLMNLKK